MRQVIPVAIVLFAVGCASPQIANRTNAGEDTSYWRGAVAADHHVASLAGLEMLERGGNAVDAAVATSFALSVVRPYSCGIGGGGFMLIVPREFSGEQSPAPVALNYREVAPRNVKQDHYLKLDDDASRFGGNAIGVPGTVAGLLYALEAHGTLDRATVLEPAIRAAESGVVVDENFVSAAQHLDHLRTDYPHLREMSRAMWERLCLSGDIEIGDVVRQPEKARALRLIAEHGAAAFYHGELADAIVAAVASHGGVLTRDDLARYTIDVTEPLRGSFLGMDLLTMPPPSSGGIALQQILGIIEQRFDDIGRPDHNSAEHVHLVVEAMKHAFADRAEYLADPLFVDVPVDGLTHDEYIRDLANRIDPRRTLEDPFAYGSVTPAHVENSISGGTSHISVVDSSGMAVACTETINLIFGSLVYVEEFGIILNNQMDDFTTVPGAPNAFGLRQSDRNVPEPGKRPLSSMSPTIVLRDGSPALVAGASGGPRIISATAQAVLNHFLYDLHPVQAVEAPRFHHQWMPNLLQFEQRWNDDSVLRELEAYGHNVTKRDEIGVVQVITVDRDGRIRAASDPRKGGRPAGW